MNVFVASSLDHGDRSDDFSYTVPGELVWAGFAVCDCPDCGCERAMAGLASSKGTTTFSVAFDVDMTPERYRQALRDAVTREGWISAEDESGLAEIDAIADDHSRIASRFEPGIELIRVPHRDMLVFARRTIEARTDDDT